MLMTSPNILFSVVKIRRAPFPEAKRPSFHEIRALGAKLYEDARISPQQLLGHTNPKTTRIYLDRHEVKWVEIDAGLVIPA
jgi:integrase